MKKAVVFLADGFEEIEALAPIDLLRRAGAQVVVAGAAGLKAKGAHGVVVLCDAEARSLEGPFDCAVCPGGMPGAANLAASWPVNEILVTTAASGGVVGAICAAPAVVLGPAGLLDGHEAVCYPGMEKAFPDFAFGEERVLVSGNIITGRGPGCAVEFALSLVEALYGEAARATVARGILAPLR